MQIIELRPRGRDLVGFIPQFLNEANPAPAKEQFDKNYAHGGGWDPFEGFNMNQEDHSIRYPGDPPYYPVVEIKFRDERVFIYESAWVAIVQPDGSHEISRMD